MIGQQRRTVACLECGMTDRWVVIAQQVSVDALRLSVRTERVVAACANCQQASEITRAGVTRFKGRAKLPTDTEPPVNGKPDPEPDQVDSDVPQRFRGRGR